MLFSIVIGNSSLAAVHNDSAPRAATWGFGTQFWLGFDRGPAPLFYVHLDNLRPPAPAVIVLNP
jgi:hypothetical protein